MVNRSKPTRALFALVAVLALFAASCGSNEDSSSDDNGTSDGGGGSGEFADLDLSSVDITVGSKDFTENQILAEMLAQSVEAGGGSVERQINLGGTNVNREALLSGDIGVYPDYNGTGWTEHLGNEDPSSDPDELTKLVREQDLEENNIHWLGQSDFSNTYGFATGPALTEENGGAFDFDSMATYLKDNPDATVCMETEFPDRSDGLVLFEDATGYEIPQDQQEILDTGIIYNETAEGNCQFGEIFTTDGRIPELDLTVVEDDNTMILYNVSYDFNDDAFQQAPEDFATISEAILNDFESDTMADLNKRVDVDGETLEDVAQSYLTDKGLI